jgi:hypothetical protein
VENIEEKIGNGKNDLIISNALPYLVEDNPVPYNTPSPTKKTLHINKKK